MEWVHCNSCFRQPGEKQFFLTNCGHIVCEICREKWVSNRCSICDEACTITCLDGKTMKPEIKVYFCEAYELVERLHKEFIEVPFNKALWYHNNKCNQLKTVLKFQRDHQKRYLQFIKQMVNKQKVMFLNMQRELQEYRNKYEAATKENAYCRKMLSSPNVVRDPSMMGSLSSRSPIRTPKSEVFENSNHPPALTQSHQFITPLENRSATRRSHDAGSGGSVNSITSGPSRISMRTPPVNGRMGNMTGNNSNASDRERFPQLFTPIGGYGSNVPRETGRIREKLAQLGCHPKK